MRGCTGILLEQIGQGDCARLSAPTVLFEGPAARIGLDALAPAIHRGSRAAVDQTLSRLARSGELLRAGRGVYVLPVKGKFGARAPEVAKVVQEWASQRTRTPADLVCEPGRQPGDPCLSTSPCRARISVKRCLLRQNGRDGRCELHVLGFVPDLEHERIVPTDGCGEKSPAMRASPGLSVP